MAKPAMASRGGQAVYLAEAESQEWEVFRSSNVSGAAYSADFKRLFIEFKPGSGQPASLYVYHDVPRGIFEGLCAAPSKGQYVYYVIRANGTDSAFGYEQLY